MWSMCRCQSLEASSSSESASAAAKLQEHMQQAAQNAEQARSKFDHSQSLLAQQEAALHQAEKERNKLKVSIFALLHFD